MGEEEGNSMGRRRITLYMGRRRVTLWGGGG